MSELNWIQKALAMQSLVGWYNFAFKLRPDGSWYIQHTGLHRRENHALSGGCQSADSPEEAMNDCWVWATCPRYYLVLAGGGTDRRAVKWNGFMWEDVSEEREP